MNSAKEFQMVRDCLHKLALPDSRPDFEGLANADWDSFLRISDEELVSAALYNLIKQHASFFPGQVLFHCRKKHEGALLFAEYAAKFLQDAKDDLCAHGRVVILQGLALLESVYPEDWARPMGDVDLYFPDGGIEMVRKVLAKLGFSPWLHYQNVWERGGFAVDLHSSLWGEERIPARQWIGPCKTEKFTKSAKLPGYFLLSKSDMMMRTYFHSLKHGFCRLLWDFDLLLLSESKESPVLPCPLNSLVEHRMNAVWCGKARARPKVGVFKNRVLHWTYLHRGHQGAGAVGMVLLFRNPLHALIYIFQTLIPPRKILEEMYGPHGFFQLLFIRAVRIFKMAGKLF